MTKRSDVVQFLSNCELFKDCTKGDLRIVARHAERVVVAPGTAVVREGDHGDSFFVLLSGTATVSRAGALAGELGPGDFFGELALLDPAPRAATVTIGGDGPAELAVLGSRMFKVLLRELPSMAAPLLASLARRARAAGAETVSVER